MESHASGRARRFCPPGPASPHNRPRLLTAPRLLPPQPNPPINITVLDSTYNVSGCNGSVLNVAAAVGLLAGGTSSKSPFQLEVSAVVPQLPGLVVNPNGSFVYTVPDELQQGQIMFQFVVIDTLNPAATQQQASFATIKISACPGPPPPPMPVLTLRVDPYVLPCGQASLTVPAPGVLGNDYASLGTLEVLAVDPTVNGDIVWNSDGSFTFTPNANFTGSAQSGFTLVTQIPYIAGVTVNGTSVSNTSTIQIIAEACNRTLTPIDDYYETPCDKKVTGIVTANDTQSPPPNQLTVTTWGPPSGGNLIVTQPSGYFEWTPPTNAAGGNTYTFTYIVKREPSGPTGTATVTIRITTCPTPPVGSIDAVDDFYLLGSCTAVRVFTDSNLLANDTFSAAPPGVTGIKFKSINLTVTPPGYGVVTALASTAWQFTPTNSDGGTAFITYTIESNPTGVGGAGLTDTATVTFTWPACGTVLCVGCEGPTVEAAWVLKPPFPSGLQLPPGAPAARGFDITPADEKLIRKEEACADAEARKGVPQCLSKTGDRRLLLSTAAGEPTATPDGALAPGADAGARRRLLNPPRPKDAKQAIWMGCCVRKEDVEYPGWPGSGNTRKFHTCRPYRPKQSVVLGSNSAKSSKALDNAAKNKKCNCWNIREYVANDMFSSTNPNGVTHALAPWPVHMGLVTRKTKTKGKKTTETLVHAGVAVASCANGNLTIQFASPPGNVFGTAANAVVASCARSKFSDMSSCLTTNDNSTTVTIADPNGTCVNGNVIGGSTVVLRSSGWNSECTCTATSRRPNIRIKVAIALPAGDPGCVNSTNTGR